MIEGQFLVFQRFSSSKLVLRAVASRFTALNYIIYYIMERQLIKIGTMHVCVYVCMYVCVYV